LKAVIKTLFRYVAYTTIALLILFLIVFAYGRLRGPTPEQQAALVLLDKKPSFKPEQNLAPYLWLLEYDVPSEKIVEIAAADAERFNALTNSNDIKNFTTQAESYPKIDYLNAELKEYCDEKEAETCLQTVKENQTTLKPMLEANAQAISRTLAVTRYRVHYSPMKLYMDSPLPAFQNGRRLLQVYYANLFINGQQNLAIEKVCDDIQAWRSIGANNNSLLASMISHTYLRQDLTLLNEMLNASDSSLSLPSSCRIALKPIEYQENMLCGPMQGEFQLHKHIEISLDAEQESSDEGFKPLSKFSRNFAYSHEQSYQKMAPHYAQVCTNDAVNAAKANQAMQIDMKNKADCDVFDWASNSAGCILAQIGAIDFQKYSNRRLDQSAQITAMQIYVWLREQNNQSSATKDIFNTRPKHLTSFSDRIRFNDKTNAIELDLLAPGSDNKAVWSLPLATSDASAAPKL
jgi:hypothetical protein